MTMTGTATGGVITTTTIAIIMMITIVADVREKYSIDRCSPTEKMRKGRSCA
jgi:hypothetical protein